jgi:formimidoylglutamate deiminase
MKTIYRPEWLYMDGRFVAAHEVVVDDAGEVIARREVKAGEPEGAVIALPGRAMLPGFVNAHSHTFQRLIRGKAESRAVSGRDFWSWRGTMYHAANRLDPRQVYDVARMAFLEMVLAGTTTVGEFHYLHNAPDGTPYDDPNLLAKQVIAAAQSVGLRIVLLRTAYLRSGFELPSDPGQRRFFETGENFLANMRALRRECPDVLCGVAPHSLRAVPLRQLHTIAEWARANALPLHMHVAEQLAENEACLREYGFEPVTLLDRERLLGRDFTAVHATHVTDAEIAKLAAAGSTVCACPTTERNLGDGIFRADAALGAGIRVALGSDSQTQIDPLEDARELEYHLRLRDQQRAVLDPLTGTSLAGRLFDCATVHGARSLGLGEARAADFFTVDLKDVSVAGNSAADLLPIVVFGMNRSAICDVMVGGRFVVRERRHALRDEIVSAYEHLHREVWQADVR